ncbi:MAG TPA: preprotein translocase subunit SecE [Asticcacaulis sp.]|nr:preprotein translocase subunit SecE [Asticcacaulis sp.]
MKKPEAKPQAKTAIGKIEPVKMAAAGATPAKTAEAAAPKKPFNPAKFYREVVQEAKRITWTAWKETWLTTVMVLLMVVIAGVFFFVVDSGLGYLTTFLTKLGQG